MRRFAHAFATSFPLLTMAAQGVAAETGHLVVNRQQRTYIIERSVGAGPRPTVIMLHGVNGTAEAIATRTGLAQNAPREGFGVVFPQGLANRWTPFAAGREPAEVTEIYKSLGGVPDDAAFLKALVADLVQRSISDPSRIYLAGLSNGGFMTLRMACIAPDAFAAVALLITSMPEDVGADCSALKSKPVLLLSGTADTIVPYGGGPVPRTTFRVWSTDRLITFFRQLNGCEGPPGRSVAPGLSQRIEIEYSGPCRGGPVLFYRVVGGTHASAPDALNSGQLMLDFFRDKVRAQNANSSRVEPISRAEPPGAILNYIAYRRIDGPNVLTGALRRAPGNEWTEVNIRGGKWTFSSVAESSSELVLHDRSRNIYLRADLSARKLFMRRGSDGP